MTGDHKPTLADERPLLRELREWAETGLPLVGTGCHGERMFIYVELLLMKIDELLARHDAATEASPAAGDDKLRVPDEVRKAVERFFTDPPDMHDYTFTVMQWVSSLLAEPEAPSDRGDR